MKVIGVMSSPHYHGNTAILTREALKGAAAVGAEVEEIYLPQYKIEYCQGCMQCLNQGRCGISDDLEMLKQKLYLADGIIISSPTFGLAPNALMKNFMDRVGMYAVYTSLFAGKYVVGISTAGAFGAKSVARSVAKLISFGFFKRGYISGLLGVSVQWNSVEKHPQQLKRAYRLGVKIADDIKNKRNYPFQNLFNRMIQALIIKKVIKNNVMNHKQDRMKAVYENLVSRGLI